MTPMCPPGGTYSIAGTLTSATDLASSRSVACVWPREYRRRRHEERPRDQRPVIRTQRPRDLPYTSNYQPGSGYHNPWGDYQCLWPSHPYLCAATHHQQLGSHMASSGHHSQTTTHDNTGTTATHMHYSLGRNSNSTLWSASYTYDLLGSTYGLRFIPNTTAYSRVSFDYIDDTIGALGINTYNYCVLVRAHQFQTVANNLGNGSYAEISCEELF